MALVLEAAGSGFRQRAIGQFRNALETLSGTSGIGGTAMVIEAAGTDFRHLGLLETLLPALEAG